MMASTEDDHQEDMYIEPLRRGAQRPIFRIAEASDKSQIVFNEETNNPIAEDQQNAAAQSSEPPVKRDEEELRLLRIRKKQELKLIKKHDKSKINVSKECWFLIDSNWLNAWSAFVNGDENEDNPGPLSTKGLLDAKGAPLPDLQAIRDYRGVPPVVYYMFVELYGKEDASTPEIARYLIDIYKSPVTVAKMVNIQVTGRVSSVKSKCDQDRIIIMYVLCNVHLIILCTDITMKMWYKSTVLILTN